MNEDRLWQKLRFFWIGTVSSTRTGYVSCIDDFHFIDGVIEALQLLKKKGYSLVVVTNQSGIARGYYSEEQFMH